MFDELLRESWVYKEWRQEAEEEAKKEDLIAVVEARFASLLTLVQERVESIKKPQLLQQLLVQIAKAQDEDEARQILLSLHSE